MRAAWAITMAFLLSGCVVYRPQPGLTASEPATQDVHFHVITGKQVLGGYTLVLTYDETAVEIVDIDSCKRNRFLPGPHFSPTSFQSGQTIVTGLSTRKVWYEGGEYHLITVTFKARRPAKSAVQAFLRDCYDLSRPPQPIKGELNFEPSLELDFTK